MVSNLIVKSKNKSMTVRTVQISVMVLFLGAAAEGFAADREGRGVHEQEAIRVEASPLVFKKGKKIKQTPKATGGYIDGDMLNGIEGAEFSDEVGRRSGFYSDEELRANGGKRPQTKKLEVRNGPQAVGTNTVSVKPKVVSKKTEFDYYLSLSGGFVDQYEMSNVQGQGAVGVGGGLLINKNLDVGVGILFNNQQSDHNFCLASNPNCQPGTGADVKLSNSIDTYSLSLLGRYFFDWGSRVRPTLGVIMAGTLREHFSNQSSDRKSSEAFDIGPMVGVDVKVIESFHLGLHWRYMTNVSFRADAESQSLQLNEVSQSASKRLSALEGSNYQVILLSGKFIF